MKNFKDRKLLLVNIIYILALAVVIFPLLLNSQYNVPSADDWSYGRNAYKALQGGAGLFRVLQISGETVLRHYNTWEGRFMNAFLASLQPGIWGEHCYAVVAWLMIGGLILGECIFAKRLFEGGKDREQLLWIPVIIPSLIMQILYTPNTAESFYWYTGAVNYTFVFGVSMIYAALILRLGSDFCKGVRRVCTGAAAVILAVMTGGDNYSTSLSMFLAICGYYLWIFIFSREKFKVTVRRTWYAVLPEAVSLVICLMAPGNRARLDANFGGETTGSAVRAVAMSLWRSLTNMYSWMNFKIFLMLLLVAPFIYMKVKNSEYRFRCPGLFSVVSFGIYASQATATLYVDGTMGGGRVAAVLYYSFHVWLIINAYWWLGWIAGVLERKNFSGKEKAAGFVGKYQLLYCVVIGGVLVISMLLGDKMELSSYRAYRDHRQGWAQQYAAEWDERFEVLHDASVSEVVFEPLSVYPETILYADLQDEYGYVWVNKACANYYSKKSITVREKTEE